jgi:hypothetical protein
MIDKMIYFDLESIVPSAEFTNNTRINLNELKDQPAVTLNLGLWLSNLSNYSAVMTGAQNLQKVRAQ